MSGATGGIGKGDTEDLKGSAGRSAVGHGVSGDAVPILFLDIDGVLNEFGSLPGGGLLGISRVHLMRLERVLDTARADIVLSSTWRMFDGSLARARAALDSIGYEIHDVTPEGGQTEGGIYKALRRGDEIKAWLALHPERTRFVVLDDDVFPDEFPEVNNVHTDGFAGALTEAKADEVIRKLKMLTDMSIGLVGPECVESTGAGATFLFLGEADSDDQDGRRVGA